MRSRAELRTSGKPSLQGPDLSFSAFGRRFELVLERNDALIRRLAAEPAERLGAIELYRGAIMGVQDSWARISRVGNEISGLIFDGVEFYGIDSLDHVAAMLMTPEGDTEGAVIYRLRDTSGLIQDEVLEPGAPTGDGNVLQKDAILPNFKSGVVLGQQIDIGVVGDFEFTQLAGDFEAGDSMIGLINIVDGIFLEGLGVHINLVELQSYAEEPDPFGSRNPGDLLGEVENVKDSSARFRPLGLLHLFTGRDLEDSSSTVQTLGIANIGVLCEPRYGVGLTQYRGGSAIDAVVAAHEIGHNFGAPHDAESGSACESAPSGMLMDAFISSSTEFSQCSIDQMLIETAGAACLSPLVPANLTLWLLSDAPPPIVEPGAGYEFDIAIENTSGVDAVDVTMLVDAPSMDAVVLTDYSGADPDRCDRFWFDRPYSCYWSEFSNGERFEATVSFRGSTPGPATIDTSVSSLTESDSTDDSLHFDVDVLPYVNLSASLDPPAISLRPDESGSVTVSVRNIGTELAHDVIAHVTVGQKLDFLRASIGECAWGGDSYQMIYDCPLGTLAAGAWVDFVVDFRPQANLSAAGIKAGAWFGLWVSSLEPEEGLDNNDNSSSTRITLGNSIGDLVIEQYAPRTAFVGDTILTFLYARNDGPDAIHDVVIKLNGLSGSANPKFANMTATGAPCRLPLAGAGPICEITQLDPGERVSLTFSITTSSTGEVFLSTNSEMSSSDPDTTNDGDSSHITVLPQPPPPPTPVPTPTPSTEAGSGTGGGSGAMDPLALSLLGFLSLLAQRRAAMRRKPNANVR
jgi:hypothetical protein